MRRLQWFALVGCLLIVPTLAHAQASIGGVVRDTSGAVLPGVTVEASSPALIEKVRLVTHRRHRRQYQIVDLRPGTYTVTFMLHRIQSRQARGHRAEPDHLPQPSTPKCHGRIGRGNGDRHGRIADRGRAEHQAQQRHLRPRSSRRCPPRAARYTMVALMPGVTIGPDYDVGGTQHHADPAFSIHGSRTGDQRLMVNGLTSRNLLASAWASNFVPDMGIAAEIALDYSSGRRGVGRRRAGHQRDPEGRRQPLLGVVLRRGREQVVPEQQRTPTN